MTIAYKNPQEAEQGLTSAFNPDTSEQSAAIKHAASLVPGQNPDPTPTQSPYYSRYTAGESAAERYLSGSTFQEPRSENAIYADKSRMAQGQIDALNRHYEALLAEQRTINEGRDRSTQAVNTLSGLAGSTEANIQQQKTTALNQKDNERILAEKNLKIQSLFGEIRKSAAEDARNQRLDARADAESILKRRTEKQTEATTQLTQLAQSGATLEGLKKTDPKSFEYFARILGGEEQVKAMITLNRPVDQILDKRIEGGKYVIAYQNPLDGKIRLETVDLGLPDNYTKTIDAGDRILAMPENWDGDPSKLITINKGLTPTQAAESGEPGDNPQLYSGLSTKTATAVRSKVGAFKTEPGVQNFTIIQEGRNFAKSIPNDTQNPADDQGLIYALAKSLDPGSVVREGEYATAQKYAQSWVQAYGKGVTQALMGTGFLSQDARTNIKNTIERKYQASKLTYDNSLSQYEKSINALTGRADGREFLIDYEIPEEYEPGTIIHNEGVMYEVGEDGEIEAIGSSSQ